MRGVICAPCSGHGVNKTATHAAPTRCGWLLAVWWAQHLCGRAHPVSPRPLALPDAPLLSSTAPPLDPVLGREGADPAAVPEDQGGLRDLQGEGDCPAEPGGRAAEGAGPGTREVAGPGEQELPAAGGWGLVQPALPPWQLVPDLGSPSLVQAVSRLPPLSPADMLTV